MKNNLKSSAESCKYAEAETMPTAPTGAAYSDSTPRYPTSFIAHISKPIGRKQLCYELRISKHLLDMWISGERKDPLTRAREVVEAFRAKGRANLIPSILIFIAGGYDGAVLSGEQFEALKVLTKAVQQ